MVLILIVEDEPMIRKGLHALLERIDDIDGLNERTIFEASGFEEADSLLRQHSFHVVFTDIEMDGPSGLALIEKWHPTATATQWVIISGYDDFPYAQKAISFGVKDYLLKPITKKTLRDTLYRLVQNLDKSKGQFVGPEEMEAIITQLEEHIWSLDEPGMQAALESWVAQMSKRSLNLTYYLQLLTHILNRLITRLNSRGGNTLDPGMALINAPHAAEANQKLMKMGRLFIEEIRLKRKSKELDPIEVAKAYITNHLNTEMSLEMVASKLGLAPTYFSQLFKQETGESFVKFRTRLRMELAKELLLQRDVRIVDIPYKIGCVDHPHFSKTFKKYTGISPSDYRSQMGID
ncbi:response regulator transcription factor [Paenibacillus koleovorans]|uniref:response regulator transcription factor n=1 Tax=Paenibacillus koleovorans TaxID=121608 RepID=UPI000FDB884C|nr:helix-turn-helix domain-containing protein [Paenibacillus koleovorans]